MSESLEEGYEFSYEDSCMESGVFQAMDESPERYECINAASCSESGFETGKIILWLDSLSLYI